MNHLLCGDEMRVIVKVSRVRKWSGNITGRGTRHRHHLIFLKTCVKKAMPSKSILCRISLPVRREFEGHGLNRYSCKGQKAYSEITGKIKGLFSFPICGLLSRCCKSILLRLRHSPRRLIRILGKPERPEGTVFAGTQFDFPGLETNTVQAFLPNYLQQPGLCGTHGLHPLSELRLPRFSLCAVNEFQAERSWGYIPSPMTVASNFIMQDYCFSTGTQAVHREAERGQRTACSPAPARRCAGRTECPLCHW